MGRDSNTLLFAIEQTRLEMIDLAHRYGFSNPYVVQCSQKLDLLLNDYNHKNLNTSAYIKNIPSSRIRKGYFLFFFSIINTVA
jgi:hypothetical protein